MTEDEVKTIIISGGYEFISVELPVKSRSKVTFLCNKHGYQTKDVRYIKGCSILCKCCLHTSLSTGKEKFIEKVVEVHGDRYDYSLVDYKNNKTKVDIICRTHGSFSMSPVKHLSGQNCPRCHKTHIGVDNIKTRLLDLTSVEIHNIEEVRNIRSEVIYTCLICGDIHVTEVRKLLEPTRKSCRSCSSSSKKKSKSDWMSQFLKVHGDFYNYDNFESEGSNKLAIVTCPIHGDFLITPSKHRLGSGCPSCSIITRKPDNKTIAERNKDTYQKQHCCLYILAVKDSFKIGISKNLKSRITSLKCSLNTSDIHIVDVFNGNRYIL